MITRSAAARPTRRVPSGWLIGLLAAALACGDSTGAPAPASIRFTVEPPTAVAGQPFGVTVELVDGSGDRLASGSAVVTLSPTGDVTLSGATAIAAVNGLALFDDLVLTRAATGVRLDALAAGRSATSAPFAVKAAAPSAGGSGFAPASFLWFDGTATDVVFTVIDAFGNPLADVPITVSSSLAGTFAPPSGVTTATGEFATRFAPAAEGNATFSATVDGQGVTFATQFVVTEFCRPGTLALPGAVNGTLPAGLCDMNGRPAAVYRLTLPSDGAAAFTTNSAFPPRIDVRTDIGEPSPQFRPTVESPVNEWLLPAGTYLFRIAAEAGTGAYAVQAEPLAGNTGTSARAIITSGTYSGQTLTLQDRDFGDGTVYDQFYLFSPRSCTVTMRSTETDSFLWAEDAITNEGLAFDDNGAGGQDARVIITPCNRAGNPIGILANANPTPNGPGVGAYTLIVEFGPLPDGAVPDAPTAALHTAGMFAADAASAAPAKRAPVRR